MQNCVSKTTKRFSDTQNKKGTRGKKTCFCVFKLKDTINDFSESSDKKLRYQLSFLSLFPRAFYTFLSNDEYRNSGSRIRHNHNCNRSRTHRMSVLVFFTQTAFFSLIQTILQKFLSIKPLWSFRDYPCILPGSYTITVSPWRT